MICTFYNFSTIIVNSIHNYRPNITYQVSIFWAFGRKRRGRGGRPKHDRAFSLWGTYTLSIIPRDAPKSKWLGGHPKHDRAFGLWGTYILSGIPFTTISIVNIGKCFLV